MTHTRFGSLGLLAAGLLPLCGGHAVAGGLVDTGPAVFGAATFDNPGSANITNPWWTLSDHFNYLYYAEGVDECEWNLVEVMGPYLHNFDPPYTRDNDPDPDGVAARIVRDRSWVDEDCESVQSAAGFAAFLAGDPEPEAAESTYDWYAQDSEKNIWYLGEDTWDGESKEGSFVAGCDGAEAGMVLLGNPEKGDFYQQEFYEDEAEDWGKVLNFVHAGDEECLETKEWTPLERGHVEHKFYCGDGDYGELAMVEELKGKTVIVELIATDVVWPGQDVTSQISSTPSCP